MIDQVKHLRLKIPQLVMTLYNEASPPPPPPFTNHCIIAWSTLLGFPRTLTFGTSLICHSYLRLTASLNSLLLRFKSISFTGMKVSQLEAPFSAARSTALLASRVGSSSGVLIYRPVSPLSLSKILSEHHLEVRAPGIRFARQEGLLPEETLRVRIQLAQRTGFSSSSSPFLTGSASSSRSLVVHVWPVIDGIRPSPIARSNGSSNSSISMFFGSTSICAIIIISSSSSSISIIII